MVCLYVHMSGSVEEMVQRMATGVARGGTLFLVGHRPVDPATGAATAVAGQVQVAVEATLAALDPDRWEQIVADDRPRPMEGTGVDARTLAFAHIACVVNGTKRACSAFRASDRASGRPADEK